MKIAIDIDDTITDTSKLLIEYIHKYGESFSESQEIINDLPDIMKGKIPNDKVKKIITQYGEEFIKSVKVKDNAVTVINNLIDYGHEIIIITSRSDEQFKGMEEVTKEYLDNNKIRYSKIITSAYEKARICKENNISILIDDTFEICEKAKEEGVSVLLFNSIVNKDIITNLPRVNGWLEVKQYIKNSN